MKDKKTKTNIFIYLIFFFEKCKTLKKDYENKYCDMIEFQRKKNKLK